MRTPRIGLAALLFSLMLAACERTSATGTEPWATAAVAALAASAAVAPAVSSPAPAEPAAAPPKRSTYPVPVRSRHVGTNLASVSYYSTQFPFANMLKAAEGWSSHEDSGARDSKFAGMTPDGYPSSLRPGQHAVAAVAWENVRYPMGRYVVLWDGDGKVSTPLSRVTVVESSARRLVVEPKDNTGPLFVAIDKTNPADPVRNVRFLWPGTEATHATQPFTPEFLTRTAPFSVLRFMDWGATNGSPIVSWAERPKRDHLSWAQRGGVPFEVMIELANTLRADPWFCIPHQANDDYVARLAVLLRDRLDPSLKAHIEYSNEVWNWGFTQTTWARDRAKALNLPTPWGTGAVYYAQRSVEVFKIFRQVYGPAADTRLVRVLAGQSAWTAFQAAALGSKDTASQVDALAIAPYFRAVDAEDIAKGAATLTRTPEQILDQGVDDIRKSVKQQLLENAALAKKHKLKLLGYESGPHLTSFAFPDAQRDAVTKLFLAANRLPRMREVYSEYYALWIASGGDAMLQYADIAPWSHFGAWGALEYLMQDPATAPKYQGLLDVIAAHPMRP